MLQKPHGKLATTSSNGDNTVEIDEPFETLWVNYEFKDPLSQNSFFTECL